MIGTTLLALIFLQSTNTTSTDPIIVVEGETTADASLTVLEQWEKCAGLMVDLLSELYCTSRTSSMSNTPHTRRNSRTFENLCICVEAARAKSKDAESRKSLNNSEDSPLIKVGHDPRP